MLNNNKESTFLRNKLKKATIFKNTFQELDKLFMKLAIDEKHFNFEKELSSIDMKKIDIAKGLLKNE